MRQPAHNCEVDQWQWQWQKLLKGSSGSRGSNSNCSAGGAALSNVYNGKN